MTRSLALLAILVACGGRSDSADSADAAIPAIETYSADNVGTATDSDLSNATSGYQGMTLGELDDVDAGISPALRITNLAVSAYCVETGADGTGFEYYYALGLTAPTVNGQVTQGSCP